MTIQLKGRIARTIFENTSGFYRIVLVDITEITDTSYQEPDIVAVGIMNEIADGEIYQFTGDLVDHPKYGQQIHVTYYERCLPENDHLIRFLSSSTFKGIGPKIAEKIVALYPTDNPIEAIIENPEPLSTIKNLSATNREAFVRHLKRQYGSQKILLQLFSYGIPAKLAHTLLDRYHEETLERLTSHPYQMAQEVDGLGFAQADRIARELGISPKTPDRLRLALYESVLTHNYATGNTFVDAKTLLDVSISLLETSQAIEIDPSLVADELKHLLDEEILLHIDHRIFHKSLFLAEDGIANNILRLMATNTDTISQKAMDDAIMAAEKSQSIHYDATQREAIQKALTEPVFILTGGPGTGKTTILKGILEAYAKLNHLSAKDPSTDSPILLAAPTGRAARRMNEVTGLKSATLHRHLGLNEGGKEVADDDLDTAFAVVDEFSMVDSWLANQFFGRLPSGCKLLLVGDYDQLPSVGPGQVLADLLATPTIPHIRLEKIYRQDASSTISYLASDIKNGQISTSLFEKMPDRSFIAGPPTQISKQITQIVTKAIASGIPSTDIQVLAPMYQGSAGIYQLNDHLQALINPAKPNELAFSHTLPHHEEIFRIGDRVLHLVNDSEANVFNGDIGVITDLIPAKYSESKQDELHLVFDGGDIIYPKKDWGNITLAYAMSIHKSQGSEFSLVVTVLSHQHKRMLKRNLLYTAITRAKKKLIMVGDRAAYEMAIQQADNTRMTYLRERFEKPAVTNELDTHTHTNTYRLTPNNYTTIDPMIGLDKEAISAFFDR